MSIAVQTVKKTESALLSDDGDLEKVFSSPVAFDILSHLGVNCLTRLSISNRAWRDLSNNEDLWLRILKRDFGEEEVQRVSGSKYKEHYMEKFKTLKCSLKTLPQGQVFLDLLKQQDYDHQTEFNGILRLDLYINYLEKDQFNTVLLHALEINCFPLIKAFLDHPKFQEIGAEKWNGLSAVLLDAAHKGHTEILKLVMQNKKFREIQPNGSRGLSRALELAAVTGQLSAMQLIMANPKFDEIKRTGPCGLGWIFGRAAQTGQTAAMQLIMTNPSFNEIPIDDGIGKALVVAAQYNQISSIEFISKSSMFPQISFEVLENALEIAKDRDRFDAIILISTIVGTIAR